jgi:hypothetical protein
LLYRRHKFSPLADCRGHSRKLLNEHVHRRRFDRNTKSGHPDTSPRPSRLLGLDAHIYGCMPRRIGAIEAQLYSVAPLIPVERAELEFTRVSGLRRKPANGLSEVPWRIAIRIAGQHEV